METPLSSPPERGAPGKGGWRVKERKPRNKIASDRHDVDTDPVSPIAGMNQDELVKAFISLTPDRRWCNGFGILSGTGIAVGVVIVLVGVLLTWLYQSAVSHPAVAETHASTSSNNVSTQEAEGVTSELNQAYRLHLGAYQSELSARLAWAGFEADSNLLLEGLDPSFDRRESDDGTLYHVLAGAYSRRDLADDHCSWLARRNLDCSIVGG